MVSGPGAVCVRLLMASSISCVFSGEFSATLSSLRKASCSVKDLFLFSSGGDLHAGSNIEFSKISDIASGSNVSSDCAFLIVFGTVWPFLAVPSMVFINDHIFWGSFLGPSSSRYFPHAFRRLFNKNFLFSASAFRYTARFEAFKGSFLHVRSILLTSAHFLLHSCVHQDLVNLVMGLLGLKLNHFIPASIIAESVV
ncbi:Uncharacterized protein APZ42_012364 [Daphnia magna]|uniref:Secreted protein n=1 Tax=Daphnia magna TaxID=35525 RepID=A0A162RX41_9CRUS|nr:Uncharacterized protein APZ42_012364 [Daphnia magna]